MANTVQDNAHILQGLSLNNGPFDVSVLTGEFSSVDALDSAVSSAVTSPNLVVIGLDPAHSWSSVHYGTGLNVEKSHYETIRKAGNPFFKEGKWAEGVEAITTKATKELVQEQQTVTMSAPLDNSQPEASSSIWFPIVLGVVLVGIAIAFLVKRKLLAREKAYLEQVREENRIQRERISNTSLRPSQPVSPSNPPISQSTPHALAMSMLVPNATPLPFTRSTTNTPLNAMPVMPKKTQTVMPKAAEPVRQKNNQSSRSSSSTSRSANNSYNSYDNSSSSRNTDTSSFGDYSSSSSTSYDSGGSSGGFDGGGSSGGFD